MIVERAKRLAAFAVLLAATGGAAGAQDRVPAPRSVPAVFVPAYPYGADSQTAATPEAERIRTLAQALERVYSTDPTLLSERASLRAVDNRYPQARSAFGPTLTVQASADYQRDRAQLTPSFARPQEGFSTTATAILNLPLYTFGRNEAQVQTALAQIAFQRDTLRLREAQIMLQAISSYVGVQRDRSIVDIARANLQLLDRQFADNTERFRVREITSTDLQQIETRVELGQAQLLSAQGQLGLSRSGFLQNVGALPADDLARPIALSVPVETLGEAILLAEASSPILRAAQSREKISRALVEQARADRGPRIDVQGVANYGTVTPFDNDLRATQLRGGVTFQQTIFDSGLRAARYREAEEANLADRRLIDAAMRDTHQAVTGAWNQLAAARASLNDYRQAVDAAQRAYQGALAQERAGARTTLDVLDLARDLLNVRNSFVVTLANEYLARANLLAAMGRLEAPLLVPGIESYDPTRHFRAVERTGDVPLLTSALAALDAVSVVPVADDRPIRDPAAAFSSGTLVELPPESAVPDEPEAALELPTSATAPPPSTPPSPSG